MSDIPLDPQLAAIVAGIRARGAPPPFSGPAREARARLARAVLAGRAGVALPEVGAIHDTFAEAQGLAVPVRVYRPRSGAPCPTLVFLHGGGFVLGSVELADDIARKFCRDLRAVIVSVEYRLAPEHPFPAAHDDAAAALRWAVSNAAALGGDPGRVGIIGESAGANLAACAALALRDAGIRLAGQLLVVPGTDMARAPIAGDFPMLSGADLAEIVRLAMGARIAEAENCPPSPLRAPSLAGLPPSVIALAGHDPLHAEGQAFAARLAADGVPVRLLEFADMFHPFLGFFAASPAALAANDTLCAAFREMLAAASL